MNDETQFDQQSYEAVRPYLQRIMEQFIAAGRTLRDFVDFTMEKFGDAVLPYLRRFLAELEQGVVAVTHFGQNAWSTLFGRNVTLEQRRKMIEEAAYFRAQQRGFAGGDPSRDWVEAEREIDAMLAEETGLFERGRKAVAAVTAAAEREWNEIVSSVSQWLSSHKPDSKSAL